MSVHSYTYSYVYIGMLLVYFFVQPISFKSYLDVFPFPFYLLLKEIRSMPLVLGDALQQWFQLINDGHYLGLTQQ